VPVIELDYDYVPGSNNIKYKWFMDKGWNGTMVFELKQGILQVMFKKIFKKIDNKQKGKNLCIE